MQEYRPTDTAASIKDLRDQFLQVTLNIQDAEYNYQLLVSTDGHAEAEEAPMGGAEEAAMGGGGINDKDASRRHITALKVQALFDIALPMRTAIGLQARTTDRLSDLNFRRRRIHDRVMYERACIFKVCGFVAGVCVYTLP